MMTDYNLRVVTYNINNQEPGEENFASLLGVKTDDDDQTYSSVPDLIAVGLQEVKTCQDQWSQALRDELTKHDYCLIHSEWFSNTMIFFWSKKEHEHLITNVKASGFICGNNDKNGAVVLTMTVKSEGIAGLFPKGVRLTVVCTHLSPHMENYEFRCQEYKNALRDINFATEEIDNDILKHDYVFWFGDLNFRINDFTQEEVKERILSGNWSAVEELKKHDQLSIARKTLNAFSDLEEEDITFHPTYKVFNGSHEYNMQRVPSWTDRILYRLGNSSQDDINNSRLTLDKNIGYRSQFKYKLSDHKPVFASFIFRA
jgi:inositol-1,4,5-trisphosphate 5-phosphatase